VGHHGLRAGRDAAIDYAERGFPLRVSTARAIVNQAAHRQLADQSETCPRRRPCWAGDTVRLPALARTLKRMVGRTRGWQGLNSIAAARNRFYKGAHRTRDIGCRRTRRRSMCLISAVLRQD
jgi:gamma-glutamyltranspeptidase